MDVWQRNFRAPMVVRVGPANCWFRWQLQCCNNAEINTWTERAWSGVRSMRHQVGKQCRRVLVAVFAPLGEQLLHHRVTRNR